MGFPFFKRTEQLLAAASAVPSVPTQSLPLGIINEGVPLAGVIFPNIDESIFPVSSDEALAVPAVARAIWLYSSISSRFVLDSTDNSTPWLTANTGFNTPQLRIARTIQDLIFHNHSMWKVERDGLGQIEAVAHVEKGRWTIENGGIVKIDNKVVGPDHYIYFQGLMLGGGLLDHARNSIRQYTSIARTINSRAARPEPVTVFKELQEHAGTTEEAQAALKRMAEYLFDNGGAMVLPYGLELQGYGGSDNANQMQIAARNAIRLDLANHANMNASLLEGAADGSSDTYTNTLLVQNELLELSIKAFTEPIADRLSANDVTPEGVTVKFNYDTFDTAPNDNQSDKGTVPVPNEVTE